MTTQPETSVSAPALDDETVAEYLCANPDFLERHPDVLAALDLSHRPGPGVVSLIERQVAELRRQNERLDARLAELMRTARDNERVGAHLLGLGRGLLEADSLDGVLAMVRDTLLSEFSADAVVVVLIDHDGLPERARSSHFLDASDALMGPFGEVFDHGAPICGPLDPEKRDMLFGEQAERIESAAVVPLRAGGVGGLIGIGSHEKGHFRADMGTLFLEQLGDLVSTAVAQTLRA